VRFLLAFLIFLPLIQSAPMPPVGLEFHAHTFTVVGQNGDAAYVSPRANTVTQFEAAYEIGGALVFLAHNESRFAELTPGDTINVWYDGGEVDYAVTEVSRWQAVDPRSVTTDLINLDTGERLDTAQFFERYFMGADKLALQTCITRDGDPAWGRLVVSGKKGE
jgi:hypothetical protein